MAPSLHPLPANPTTGQHSFPSIIGTRGISAIAPANPSSGGVSRETLKGLQDVAWSDDEDDPDCLLCAEPLDLSDLNFKPCQCGMQICQFCYNKLLQSDARCPGCRRPYDAKAVVFQPVDWEEVKRAKERKTKRAKIIKQLTGMGRRNLLGVRIVMKNMVYVIGMKLPAPGDDAIPILRSNDYFGQYGKIAKLYLCDRTKLSSTSVPTLTPDNPSTSTGIYIVYVRREDAARAISSLDGIQAPQGAAGQLLKATYGTTRYCDAFLRGAKCDSTNCHNLHEWGGDSDCFTKEDMETALTRPAEYDARQKQTQLPPPPIAQKSQWPKPSAEESSASGLPSSANWGKVIGSKAASRAPAPSVISRPTKIGNLIPLGKSNAAFPLPTPSPTIPITIKDKKERKSTAAAMARGRSTDSTQSATTSSNQTSPKKKASVLPPLSTVNPTPTPAPASPPPPPPGLTTATSTTSITTTAAAETVDESVDEGEGLSADSDAGPSSASPAPQTPARSNEDIPPAPLSTEPILVHSPYPEPVLFSFPTHDKDFAFVLGLDDGELQRRQADAGGYEPSPFSKTLEGLAELGVHAPELPELFTPETFAENFGYAGLFRPFDPDAGEGDSPLLSDSTPGPSRLRNGNGTGREENHNAQRTESRFDFARPSSASIRGQSPFSNMRRPVVEPTNLREGFYARQSTGSGEEMGHQQTDARSAVLAAQVASFVGSYDSAAAASASTENGWAGESPYPISAAAAAAAAAGSPSHHRQNQMGLQYERSDVNARRLEILQAQNQGQGQFLHGGKNMRDREEYDTPVLQYGNAQIYGNHSHVPTPNQQRLFSPTMSMSMHNHNHNHSHVHSQHDEGYHSQSPSAALASVFAQQHHHHQQQQQHQPDARQLMALHQQHQQQQQQQRVQSPPLAQHGYRRF